MTQHSVRILTLADRRGWEAAHALEGLPSQSWRYARALAASGSEPMLAVVEAEGARMLLPFVLREWRGARDVSSLIGTAGASISPAGEGPLRAWSRHAAAQGWVAGYLQLSSLTKLGQAPEGDRLVTTNEWFELDLAQPPSDAGFSVLLRRKIRRAAAEGVRLEENRTRLADAIVALFPQAMRRVGARPHYFFSEDTLRAWAGDPSSLVLGAQVDAQLEAVAIFTVSGMHAEYHINASSERGRGLAGWLLWQAMQRLAQTGVETLHLGGGVVAGDGLHRFKRQFGGRAVPMRSVRQVYRPEAYAALLQAAGVVDAPDGWFPLYRSASSHSVNAPGSIE